MPPDRFRPTNGHTRFLAGAGRHGLPFALALGLGACGTTPPPSAVPAPTTPPLSTGAPELVCAAPVAPTADSPSAPQPSLCASAAAEPDTLASLLVYTERLRARLGLDYSFSNEPEIAAGKLTGRIVGPVLDAGGKAAAVRSVREALGLSPEQVIAVGDGANDLAMMAEAGVSIAYHAKQVVQQQTTYSFNHVGLDGLLNLYL
ncbi:MAG: hypothetical protein A2W72_02125 [Burkholderiales bacterium RIFCSPLOWO2_12_67_14]|nr:MAG: hypothetical protein A2W72_02125 [Burkholderiales bacterium RIFCSPLOWO2_12_67_14]